VVSPIKLDIGGITLDYEKVVPHDLVVESNAFCFEGLERSTSDLMR
jgi:hypothetical protein